MNIETREILLSRQRKNKGTDQPSICSTADLHLYFFTQAKSRFSHDAAHVSYPDLSHIMRKPAFCI